MNKPIETLYASIDRDTLRQLQADSEELARLRAVLSAPTAEMLKAGATVDESMWSGKVGGCEEECAGEVFAAMAAIAMGSQSSACIGEELARIKAEHPIQKCLRENGELIAAQATIMQLNQLIAAKEAEIARVTQERDGYLEVAHTRQVMLQQAQADLRRAQPARPVGDEREAYCEYIKLHTDWSLNPSSTKGWAFNDADTEQGWRIWQARAALAPVAVVMPERRADDYQSPRTRDAYNAALDEVARLNAHPLPLAEREGSPLDGAHFLNDNGVCYLTLTCAVTKFEYPSDLTLDGNALPHVARFFRREPQKLSTDYVPHPDAKRIDTDQA